MVTITPALRVIKYDPMSTWAAECYEDFSEGALICLNTTGKWIMATAQATSQLATHVALTDGSATPTGEGCDTTKYCTGFTRGFVEVSTAWTNYGGTVYLGNSDGQYSDIAGTASQAVGTLVDTRGRIVQVGIVPTSTSNNAA